MAGFVVIVAIIVIGIWQLNVRWHPVRLCPSCKGSKHNPGSTSTRWGTCRRCGGKGEIRRFGA